MLVLLLAAFSASAMAMEERVECPPAPVKPDVGDRCEWIPIMDKQNCIRKYECMPIPPAPCPAPPQYPSSSANCRWVAIRDAQDCIVSWECTPNRSTFDDQHHHCCYWAQVGECMRNPAYMATVCRASCSVSGCSDFGSALGVGHAYECQANHRQQGCPYNGVAASARLPFLAKPLPRLAVPQPIPFSAISTRPAPLPSLIRRPLTISPSLLPLSSVPLPVAAGPSVISAPTYVASSVTAIEARIPRPLIFRPQLYSAPLAAPVQTMAVAPSSFALPPAPPIQASFAIPRSIRPALAVPLSQPVMALPPAPPRLPTRPSPLGLSLASSGAFLPPCDPCGGLEAPLQPERIVVPVPVKVPIKMQPPPIYVHGPPRTVGFQGANPANPHGGLHGSLSSSVQVGPINSLGSVVQSFGPLHTLTGPSSLLQASAGRASHIAFPKGSEASAPASPGDPGSEDARIREVVKTLREASRPLVKTGTKDYREQPTFADKMGLDGKLFDLPQHLIDAVSELEEELTRRKAAGGGKLPAVLGIKLPEGMGDGKGFPIRLPEELLGAIRRYKDALRKRRAEAEEERRRRLGTTPRPVLTTPSGTRPPLTFWLGARENTNPPKRAYITVGYQGITARPIGHYSRLRSQLREEGRRRQTTLRPTTRATTTRRPSRASWRDAWTTSTDRPISFRLGGGSQKRPPPPRRFATLAPRIDRSPAARRQRRLRRWKGKEARRQQLAEEFGLAPAKN